MDLHVQTTTASGAKGAHPPVILVHGAWHASWCWTEHWTGFLADHGYATYAVDLRGHGRSGGRLRRSGIRDYVADVRTVAASLDQPPVLIGHSMGGFVVQHYLMRYTARARVLIAPVPTRGAIPATLRVARRYPLALLRANLALDLGPIVDEPERATQLLFGPDTPASDTQCFVAKLQGESYLAYLGMMFALPRPSRVADPMLVLAGSQDKVFTPREAEATAAAYDTEAVIFDGMGHDAMLDVGWENVAGTAVTFMDRL